MKETKITAEEINNNISYLFEKIDWGKSWLDSKAIDIMNNLSKNIKKLEEQSRK